MSKNKDKNQYGTFHTRINWYVKNMRLIVSAFVVVIFILGAGAVVWQKRHKTVNVAETKGTNAQIPGWWYQQYFGSSVCTTDVCKSDADPDLDGLTNAQEFYYHTDPLSSHTAKDALNDGQLVTAGFDPSRTGRMTFDQVTAPDNILGESLLVDQNLKDILIKQNDITKVALPLVADDQLKITQDQNPNTYANYIEDLNGLINKYFTQSDLSSIGELLKSGSGSDIITINTKSMLLASDLQAMIVPQKMLLYHKYTLAFFTLLPKVLLDPSDPALSTDNAEGDIWYQNTQALLVVVQNLNSEEQRLHLTNQLP